MATLQKDTKRQLPTIGRPAYCTVFQYMTVSPSLCNVHVSTQWSSVLLSRPAWTQQQWSRQFRAVLGTGGDACIILWTYMYFLSSHSADFQKQSNFQSEFTVYIQSGWAMDMVEEHVISSNIWNAILFYTHSLLWMADMTLQGDYVPWSSILHLLTYMYSIKPD